MQELAKKTKDPSLAKEDGYPICYPTSFLPLDYRNGLKVSYESMDMNTRYTYDAIGINSGAMVMFIGKNGSGKTAIAIQAATSIAQRFKNSCVLHLDLERGTNKMRIKMLSGWDALTIQNKYILSSNINTPETVKQTIVMHCKNKLLAAANNPSEACYFTGLYDMMGQPIYELVPTIVLLDSIPMLYKGNEEGATNQIVGAHTAKAISDLVKTVVPMCKKANVLFFVINHINDKISTNSFIPQQAQNNYLTQSESLPGKHGFARDKAV